MLISATALTQVRTDLGDAKLYQEHDWFALRDRIKSGAIRNPLYLGATAAAFGDEKRARSYLEPLLRGEQAAEAHIWLSYLDIRKGRYRAAATHIEAAGSDEHDPLAAAFRELPDQVTVRTSPATVSYSILQRKLFLPVSINGQRVEFFLDSDANLSFLSEKAAKRLGLTIHHSSATTTGALGAQSQLSFASANVEIGKTQLRGVAFMVLPDNASLFTTLEPQQQGALGLPVLLALERVSWDRAGSFRIGSGSDPSRPGSSLAFDGADPIVRFSHAGVALTGVFDTGAETTNLWPPFAARFSELLKNRGTPGTRQVRGFGGNGQVPETVVPELDLEIGGIVIKVAPAHILTGKTTANSDWLAGRMGLDLLLRARHVTVDFRANKLQLAN
jgi:hypothetical protein